MTINKFFPEIHGNFGFGCMRLPMRDGEVDAAQFCEMTDEEIDAYIATGDPMDKAGAYGVQSYAAPFVSALYGDYYNVMGLPASRLYHALKAHGCI